MATLIVKSPDGVEREIALVKRITSVGRDAENDVAVPDPAMPRTALHIHWDGRDYNAAAHDGTDMTVNGKRRSAWRLGAGDRIRVAGTELAFDPAPRAAAPVRPSAGQRLLALETLVRFSERLLGANDLARLLDELIDALLEVTHADKGFLILFEDGDMTVRAARNVARETIEGAVARVSDSIIQRVIDTRRPIVVADALHDAEWSGSTSVVNLKLCSVMCAPLMQKGDVCGVIYLGNDSVVSLFDDRALEALTVFAAQASLLVQNGMLLDSLRRENVALKEAVSSKQYGELIGSGASMREVYRRIEKVAGTDITVLVTGETGTGKEVVAREVHRRSGRRERARSSRSTAARSRRTLLESELFGHVRGAFTGAVATRPGQVPGRRRRHALPRRDRRDAGRAAGEAPARAAGAVGHEGRRHARRAGRHPRRRRHEQGPRGRDQEGRASARTSTTGSTSSRSSCRRSASAATTSSCSRSTSCRSTRRSSARGCAASPRAPSSRCASTPGPGTSASSRTA